MSLPFCYLSTMALFPIATTSTTNSQILWPTRKFRVNSTQSLLELKNKKTRCLYDFNNNYFSLTTWERRGGISPPSTGKIYFLNVNLLEFQKIHSVVSWNLSHKQIYKGTDFFFALLGRGGVMQICIFNVYLLKLPTLVSYSLFTTIQFFSFSQSQTEF